MQTRQVIPPTANITNPYRRRLPRYIARRRVEAAAARVDEMLGGRVVPPSLKDRPFRAGGDRPHDTQVAGLDHGQSVRNILCV
jgi:hypothetical protein